MADQELEPFVRDLETVEEPYRPLYEPHQRTNEEGEFEDWYRLKLRGGVPDVTSLKRALESERTLRKEGERRLTGFGKWTPKAITQLSEDHTNLKARTAQTRAEFDVELKDVQANFEAQIGDLTKKLKTRDSELERLKLDEQIKRAALGAGIEKTKVEKVLVLVKHSGRVALSGDRVVIRDELTGEPTGLTLEKFFRGKWKEENAEFFEPKKIGGSGAPASGGGSESRRNGHVTAEFLASLTPSQYRKWRKTGSL